jgi:hypothetical protein
MTRRTKRTAIYALAANLVVFAAVSWAQTQTQNAKKPAKAATTGQNVPEEYQSGISQLRVAKAYLEKAGDKWGGYRIKGIASIDRAFRVFGVSAESTPGEMQSGNTDEPSMMNSGISSLQTARDAFASIGDNWGGRKEKGIALVDQALQDLQTGIDWAKEHKTY